MTFKTIALAATAIVLVACGDNNPVKSGYDAAHETAVKQDNSAKLATILTAQPEKAKARYDARNPQATLEFFGVEPGMTLVDILPGGGWYSKILIPYLGDEGHMIGVDYSIKMWPEFGGFADEEFIEGKKTWAAEWVEGAQAWRAGSEGKISAFTFGDRDTSMDGKADMALFIRALHNLSRFEDEGGYMTEALADTHALLKPGGLVGVVQHQGPETNEDKWAEGDNGYLKLPRLKRLVLNSLKSQPLMRIPKMFRQMKISFGGYLSHSRQAVRTQS